MPVQPIKHPIDELTVHKISTKANQQWGAWEQHLRGKLRLLQQLEESTFEQQVQENLMLIANLLKGRHAMAS